MNRPGSHVRLLSSAITIASTIILLSTAPVSAGNPIAHRVTAGGPDSCTDFGVKPGCDGNFSFIAIQAIDGSVSGQYTDRFSRGEGFHGVIDCLVVVGNEAWVSGTITSGTGFSGFDLAGLPFTTVVQDNGSSANQPPDAIGSSHVGNDTSCLDQAPFLLKPTPQGQVTVQ